MMHAYEELLVVPRNKMLVQCSMQLVRLRESKSLDAAKAIIAFSRCIMNHHDTSTLW